MGTAALSMLEFQQSQVMANMDATGWIRTAADATRRWREQHGYAGRGGVVVLFGGEVQGWVNTLRDPGHWRPGCVAVDESGTCWQAVLGPHADGALMWLPIQRIKD